MKMGEPVVGWIEPGPLRKVAVQTTRFAAVMAVLGLVCLGDLVLKKEDAWIDVTASALFAPMAAMYGWIAWLYWRTLRHGWGALQARFNGDSVVMGTPFSMSVGRGKRFVSNETLALSVTTRTIKRRLLSEWTMTGSRGAVIAKSLGVWTEEQWHELAIGLQRLGFTVVAGPDAADSRTSAHGG